MWPFRSTKPRGPASPVPQPVVQAEGMTLDQAVARVKKLREMTIPYYESQVRDGKAGHHDPAPYQAKLSYFQAELDSLSHFIGRKIKG